MSAIQSSAFSNSIPSLTNARVLVTGASGFLGAHLCQRLCREQVEVHATSRTPRTAEKGGPVWWQTNLENLDDVRTLISKVKPQILFHLSGLASAVQSLDYVLPTFHSLLTSTVNLLTVATELHQCRIVLAGSLNEPQPNEVEVTPSSPYAAAKWASSGYGRMFHTLYGTPVVVVRTFMTYGPGQDSRKLIPLVVSSLLKGEAPQLSSGRWKADWIYIDDVIDGFFAAAQMKEMNGATLDLGSGTLVTVRHLVERLVGIMGSPVQPLFGVLPDRLSEPSCKADILTTYEKVKWKPKVTLEEGLLRTVDWYRARVSRC